jgi:phosphatidylglycerophosphate synthase
MSKLAKKDKFLDLSDYGRSPGKLFAKLLKNTPFNAIHVSLLFALFGLIAVYFMLQGKYVLAGLFLILKSIIDAADGELARLKNKPSYIGRYLDSLLDILLNFIFFTTISYITKTPFYLAFIAFFACQLQGTLYNYYYVILRNKSVGGDSTSKIFEYKTPTALHGESQKIVNFLFSCYLIFYGIFDKIIHFMDQNAHQGSKSPKWFMTLISIYGLGFQLLIIAVLLSLNYPQIIIPFFIFYSTFIAFFIVIRKFVLKG